MTMTFDVVAEGDYDQRTDRLTLVPTATTEFKSAYDRMQERVRELEAANEKLVQEKAEVEAAHAQWKLETEDAAQRRANDAGYCSDFDAFMLRRGMKAREWTYTFRYQHEVRSYVYIDIEVRGRDEHKAMLRGREKLNEMIKEIGGTFEDLPGVVKEHYDNIDRIRNVGQVNRVPLYPLPDEESKYLASSNYRREELDDESDYDEE